MKKIFLIICISSLNMYSQINDARNNFVIRLLEENILTIENDQNEKNFDPQKVEIEVDTLNSNYFVDILFLKFKFNQNKLIVTDQNFKLGFSSSSCDEYILAYNTKDHRSYRLKGFNGNDLLFLLRDLEKLSYISSSPKKIVSELHFLNIGIDFKSIYKALMKLDFEAECLKACIDGKVAHGKIK
ncbi:hypothetical protein [Flavobacterium sp.]|uniref:hypothetical protein n=1 Tax=Flavobacterium sp. TaxID=239 RepID=UPI00260BFE5C|nr:hypothetical protein [Flavobacterium sp.]MDD3005395.1 hypothetical protein [Flavobacterium sp.]